MRRKKRSSDNENENVLQENDTNNDTENDTALSENDNVFPHYETINESGMIEMFHPITSQNLSHLTWASNIVQSSQPDNTYLEVVEADSTYLDVIEDTNNQKLDPRIKLNGDEDHLGISSSSPRGEKNTSTLVFYTKNCEVDKGNTINKESPVTIETNNFEDCKTSVNSISVSSSSSEQSAGERILERDQKACEHPSQYMSLNMNDMEYLNSYSSLITENKQRESESQNSNNSESSGTNIL
ncbi:unnamed protein product [Mytilus coruscus]|uniref:Uncharacterized protein n=1 Tax=Mytilus coruscus TaxID=42192 RepID=A0A6J8EZX9_MYTCO|nr:unnamed protein product [Mytilus coruscus]